MSTAMSTIKAVYEAIIANVDDADELRDLAQMLEAEAERRSNRSNPTPLPAAAWPFPTRHDKSDKEDEDQGSAKSGLESAWPFNLFR
jgi:hypothetical protein